MVRSSDGARWCHRPTFREEVDPGEGRVTVARSKEKQNPLKIYGWNPKNWWFVGVLSYRFHVSFQGLKFTVHYLPNPRDLQQQDYHASGIKIVPVVINLLNFFEHQNDVVTWRPLSTTKKYSGGVFFCLWRNKTRPSLKEASLILYFITTWGRITMMVNESAISLQSSHVIYLRDLHPGCWVWC